jgi:DeoR/GlpR family transcriptional regulator of sugar metabolism
VNATDSSREQRLTQLLDTIRTRPGKWSAGHVQELRRRTGGPTQRGTARRDLAELHRRGLLQRHGQSDGRFYTLDNRKGGTE